MAQLKNARLQRIEAGVKKLADQMTTYETAQLQLGTSRETDGKVDLVPQSKSWVPSSSQVSAFGTIAAVVVTLLFGWLAFQQNKQAAQTARETKASLETQIKGVKDGLVSLTQQVAPSLLQSIVPIVSSVSEVSLPRKLAHSKEPTT